MVKRFICEGEKLSSVRECDDVVDDEIDEI